MTGHVRAASSFATLACLLALATLAALGGTTDGRRIAHASPAREEPSWAGRRLADVLRELRQAGLELIWSSAVVGDELRVAEEPPPGEPRARLAAILAPHGLRAEDGPRRRILIVRAPPGAPAEETAETPLRSTLVTRVEVTPGRHSIVHEDQAPQRSVAEDEIVLAPTVAGDVTRIVALLPGIASESGSAAINVRGSLPGDASLVLDGLELYAPFHLQGFHSPFSLIDANVVERIDVLEGGFTVERGDRHGGFIEIATRGPLDGAEGEIELGSLNSRVSYRAPRARGSGWWLVSARGWYPEAVFDATELGAGEKLDPRFQDLYATATLGGGARHLLSLHGLAGRDRLKFQEVGEEINERVDSLTRSGAVWLRARSAWAPGLTSDTALSFGRIDRERRGLASEDGAVRVDDSRSVDFVGLRHDAVWRMSEASAVKLGADVRRLSGDYRYAREVEADPSRSTELALAPDGTTAAVWAAYRARLGARLLGELGLRWDRQTHSNDNQLAPRLNALWRPGERSELRLAVGRFNQSQRIHELRVEDGEDRFRRAEVAEVAELSWQRQLGAGLRLRLDAYTRRLEHLHPRWENLFEPIELFPEVVADRVLVEPERAALRGVELLLRGDGDGPLFWWVSYARSRAEDTIDGQEVPRSWDQPHAGGFLVGYRRDGRWSVSLAGAIRSGWPRTPALVGPLDETGEPTVLPGPRNSERHERYVRLDVEGRRAFRVPAGRLWLSVAVVNVTDEENACCLNEVVFVETPRGDLEPRRLDDTWLGATPSFSVLWTF